VNCFQKIVSLIFWTTPLATTSKLLSLWIAFKKLYLWYSEQRKSKRWKRVWSCELLSKNCIFDILNNSTSIPKSVLAVVNCFQKIVSLIFWTTFNYEFSSPLLLWIAFKKLYLWYSEQQQFERCFFHDCCELLSKNCIFDILNNWLSHLNKRLHVVNCFQKIVSLIFWTTSKGMWEMNYQLWIAFKKLYLWYSEQPHFNADMICGSCELLSKNCIFDILNNKIHIFLFFICVVNCFQKIVSLIFWTTLKQTVW